MNFQISSKWIENATRAYIVERAQTHPEIARFVSILNALPLYADWGGGVAMRADGELIGFLWDEPHSIKVERDPHFRFLALVHGSERYPELASLTPQRSAKDRDCPLCGGTGVVAGLREHGIDTKVVQCYCGGTGWLPADVADPPGS